MTPEASGTTVASLDARCTPDGLIAQYQALFFETVTLQHGKEWFIHDKSTDKEYELFDLRPAPGTFCCNALLLKGRGEAGQDARCVTVMIDPSSQTQAAAGEFRPDSEYKKDICIRNIMTIKAGDEFVVARSGQLMVCLT